MRQIIWLRLQISYSEDVNVVATDIKRLATFTSIS